jgi:Retroviral aspartyl protease
VYTLFDSGSTTDAISPDFTQVASLPVKQLDKPVTLRLGCSGSRSKVNFATESCIEFASITIDTYLDIANLDKYDSILGTPFLWKHGIQLDFETQEIVIHGKLRIPALPEGEGSATATMMKTSRHHGK